MTVDGLSLDENLKVLNMIRNIVINAIEEAEATDEDRNIISKGIS